MLSRQRLYPRSMFIILLTSILILHIAVAEGTITAKYSYSSNFYIFINIKKNIVERTCHTEISPNGVPYAVINPNNTVSVITINGNYITLNIRMNNVTIYTLTPEGKIQGKCTTTLTYKVKYRKTDLLMPIYNHSIAGGFPYIGLKTVIGSKQVLVINLGTRDFELKTPRGYEGITQRVPGNVLSASPVVKGTSNLTYIKKLFETVFGGVGSVEVVRQDKYTYVIEVIPSNASAVGLLEYGITLGPPPGRRYSYGNISVPASLVSSKAVSGFRPSILSLGSYKVLYYDDIIYFTARGFKKVYVVSLELVPTVVPNGNLNVYDVSYRWDNGLLLNATFKAFLAYPAVQGFILEGPILDDLAVDNAKYGVVYGIVPPKANPEDYLGKVVSNPLGAIAIPFNARLNVHLVEYSLANPPVTTVSASSSNSSVTKVLLALLAILISIILIIIYKNKT